MPPERLHLLENMSREEQEKLISREPKPVITVATQSEGKEETKSLIYTLYQIIMKAK